MPIRSAFSSNAPKSSSNEGSQDVFRRRVLIKRVLNGQELGSTNRFLQDLGIEAQFIAEVIIDGSDIRSRSCTDLANSRGLIAPIGENRASDLQQPLACWICSLG
jgi:hypothetical protein